MYLCAREADGMSAPSLAAMAEGLGWFMSSGRPYKAKADRALKALRADKLVTIERRGAELTDKGRKAAKKAQYNRDAAGASYG